MPKSAQKISASTQHFTEIEDIVDDVVILSQNYASLVIEVQAINFSLLSKEEQEAKLVGYASLLNSLAFPIQILIRNKKMDITNYIKLLEQEAHVSKNEKLKDYITQYQKFIQELVKNTSVLDKKFYVIIPFSALELGAIHALKKEDFIAQAKAELHAKADSIQTQLGRLSLLCKLLQKNELISLFYDLYNSEDKEVSPADVTADIDSPVVQAKNI